MLRMKLFIICLVCALQFFSSFAYTAEPQVIRSTKEELVGKVQSMGSLPVIIKFKLPFVPEFWLSAPQGVARQQARIVRAQNALESRLTQLSISNIKKYTTIPYMALRVDEQSLKALLKDQDILQIEEDIPVPPTLNLSIPFVQADDMQMAGYTGAGYAVAVLDTGVKNSHEFLDNGKVISEACYGTTTSGIAPDSSFFTSTTVCPSGGESQTGAGSGVNCDTAIDGCSHGTHVAGIVAGSGGAPGVGVAPDAEIIAIQVFSRFDSTYYCGASNPCALTWTSDQILALERVYALRNTYNIAAVNMSLGGGAFSNFCDSDSRKPIIDQLRTAGIATVIASGNDSFNGLVGRPGCISSAITVGATLNSSDSLASYSNHANMVDLLAPGSSINSSTANSMNSYASWNGTSMATPHVAGAFALMKQKNNSWSVTEIENLLESTGINVSRAGITKPRIDIFAAAGITAPGPTFPWSIFFPAFLDLDKSQ